jgi:hypothetical protein
LRPISISAVKAIYKNSSHHAQACSAHPDCQGTALRVRPLPIGLTNTSKAC